MIYTAESIDSFIDDMNGALSKCTPRRVFIMFSDASSMFSCIVYRVQHVEHADGSVFFYDDHSEVVAEIELTELGDGYRVVWDRSGFTVFFYHA